MKISAKKQSIPSIPQALVSKDGVQIYTSVDNKSSTTQTQNSLESNTNDSPPLICSRSLSAARKCSKLERWASWSKQFGAMRNLSYGPRTLPLVGRMTIIQIRHGYIGFRFQRWGDRKCVRGMLEARSPDKSRRLLSKRFYQKLTSQPLMPWPHSSSPSSWRSSFEWLNTSLRKKAIVDRRTVFCSTQPESTQ